MGKKTEKASKPIGYQDIRRLFGRATQSTQAARAAYPAENRQPPAACDLAGPGAASAVAGSSKGHAHRSGYAPSRAPTSATTTAVARPAAQPPTTKPVASAANAAPAATTNNTSVQTLSRHQPTAVPNQQVRPARPPSKRPAAPASAAEAAAAHAARSAASRAAKTRNSAAKTDDSTSGPDQPIQAAAGPGLGSPAAPHAAKQAGVAGGSVACTNDGPNVPRPVAPATSGQAALGPGTLAAPAARSMRPADLAAAATASVVAAAAAVAGTSAANAPANPRPGWKQQQQQAAHARFSKCIGFEGGEKLAMTQLEDLPEVHWERSPPALILPDKLRTNLTTAAAAAARRSGSSEGAVAGTSALDHIRGTSRSRSHTPAAEQQVLPTGPSAASNRGSNSETRCSPTTSMLIKATREGDRSSFSSAAPCSSKGSRQPSVPPGLHRQPDSTAAAAVHRQGCRSKPHDLVLQQVLDSACEPCPHFVLATPGGPRLRAFKQQPVLPPSTGGGSSCQKLRRQQRRISTEAAAAAASCTAGAGGTAAGTGSDWCLETPRGEQQAGQLAVGPRPVNSSGQIQQQQGVVGSATPGSTTAKKQQAGLKRRVLLELLEKVQDQLKHPRMDNSSRGPEDDTEDSPSNMPVRQLLNSNVAGDEDYDAPPVVSGAADADDLVLEAVLMEAGLGAAATTSQAAAAGRSSNEPQSTAAVKQRLGETDCCRAQQGILRLQQEQQPELNVQEAQNTEDAVCKEVVRGAGERENHDLASPRNSTDCAMLQPLAAVNGGEAPSAAATAVMACTDSQAQKEEQQQQQQQQVVCMQATQQPGSPGHQPDPSTCVVTEQHQPASYDPHLNERVQHNHQQQSPQPTHSPPPPSAAAAAAAVEAVSQGGEARPESPLYQGQHVADTPLNGGAAAVSQATSAADGGCDVLHLGGVAQQDECVPRTAEDTPAPQRPCSQSAGVAVAFGSAGQTAMTDGAAETAAEAEETALEDAAAAVGAAEASRELPGVCSQEVRVQAAAKELEDFELLYGGLEELLASQGQPPQQQQQPAEPADGDSVLDDILAGLEQPAAKRQKLQQQPGAAGVPAAAAGMCQTHAAVAAAAAACAGDCGAPQGLAAPCVTAPQVSVQPAEVDNVQRVPAGLPAASLAGGRMEVYHEVVEAVHGPSEVLLRCVNPYKGSELWVHLSHPWCDCPVVAGDKANVIEGVRTLDAEGRSHVYLDHANGMFVLHPDVLLSGTAITTALSCVRRAWLTERFAAAGGGPGAAATRGTLLHELLQRLLVEVVGQDDVKDFPGVQQLEQMVLELLADSGEKLHEVGLTEAGAAREMNKHLANISSWLRSYLPPHHHCNNTRQQQQQQQAWQLHAHHHHHHHQKQQHPSWQQSYSHKQHSLQQQQQQQQLPTASFDGAFVDVGPDTCSKQRPRVMILGVADIEENIWAPKYGLKGQLDASLLIQLSRTRQQGGAASGAAVSGCGKGQASGGRSWGQSSGGSGWGQGRSGGSTLDSPQQQHAPGSGWRAGQHVHGGLDQHWQQQQQVQPGVPACASGGSASGLHDCHAGGGGDSCRGVFQQVDMNKRPDQTRSCSGGQGAGRSTGPALPAVTTGAGASARPAESNSRSSPQGHPGPEVTKHFKGKASRAAAAIRTFWQGQASQQGAALGRSWQHTSGGHVRGLAAGSQKQQQQLSGGCMHGGLKSTVGSGGAEGLTGAHSGSNGLTPHFQTLQQQQQGMNDTARSQTLIVPFEFKTGKDYFSHKAQVSLYLLLMEVRYKLGLPPAGLLWNVNSQSMVLVPAKQEELASLLACRNRLAAHLWQQVPTPPAMLGDAYACSRCHSAPTCAAVHAVMEAGTADSSGMEPQHWELLAGDLSGSAASWGRKWLQLLDWEESAGRARRPEIWALTGAQRQLKGSCIAGLQLTHCSTVTGAEGAIPAAADTTETVACVGPQGAGLEPPGGPMTQAADAASAGPCGAAVCEEAAGHDKVHLYTFQQQPPYCHLKVSKRNAGNTPPPPPQQQQVTQHSTKTHAQTCLGTAVDAKLEAGTTAACAGATETAAELASAASLTVVQPIHLGGGAGAGLDGRQICKHTSSTGQDMCTQGAADTLQGCAVSPGDMLLLSADGLQVNVGRVDVVDVDGCRITVASSKDLQLDRFNASAAGETGTSGCSDGNNSSSSSRILWRLDQDDAASIGMNQRAAVLRLAADSTSSIVKHLRELLVDMQAPTKVSLPSAEQCNESAVSTAAVAQDVKCQTDKETGAAEAAGGAVGSRHPQAAAASGSISKPPSVATDVVGDDVAVGAGSMQPAGAARRLAAAAGQSYLSQHGEHLNSNQVEVLQRVLAMQDYCLVLGMPGTGKTSTIVHAVRALVASGASVLVTAYTNSALDNILIKLADAGQHEFLRLGRNSSCHTRIRQYMPGGDRYPHRSTAELHQLAASTPVVGCPCLSAHHPLLATRPPFDVVIVDEAGQITTPAVLPALLRGRSFVLVGDHHQLPPLVLDPRAQAGGLGFSLFRQLCEAHPSAVVGLQQQYRMAGPIMALANELVYKGQLQAGNPAVEAAQLTLQLPNTLLQAPPWVAAALDPCIKLAFLDTDTIQPAASVEESAVPGGGVINTGEAQLVMQLLQGLLAAGVPAGDIGIISPYKAQVALLQKLADAVVSQPGTRPAASGPSTASARTRLQTPQKQTLPAAASAAAVSHNDCVVPGAQQVEVLTIDRCQGRDKAVILLSFVRCNAKGATGALLTDTARLNVAITRAKVKLLMVGSAGKLGAGVPLLAQCLDWVRSQGLLVQLPEDALGL